MEFDLESGPGIKGDEPIPEEDDAVDTVTCCAVSRLCSCHTRRPSANQLLLLSTLSVCRETNISSCTVGIIIFFAERQPGSSVLHPPRRRRLGLRESAIWAGTGADRRRGDDLLGADACDHSGERQIHWQAHGGQSRSPELDGGNGVRVDCNATLYQREWHH